MFYINVTGEITRHSVDKDGKSVHLIEIDVPTDYRVEELKQKFVADLIDTGIPSHIAWSASDEVDKLVMQAAILKVVRPATDKELGIKNR